MTGHRRKWEWTVGEVLLVVAVGLVIAAAIVARQPLPAVPNPLVPSPNGYDVFVRSSALVAVRWGEPESVRWDHRPWPRPVIEKPTAEVLAAIKQAPGLNSPALAMLRTGLNVRCLAPQDRGIDVTHPELSRLRALASAVRASATAYAAMGQYPKATQTALDGIEMGEDITNGATLLSEYTGHQWEGPSGLTGLVCCSIDRRALWPIIDNLDSTTAHSAAQRLASIDSGADPFSDILVHEKWATEAMLEAMCSHPNEAFWLQVMSLRSTRSILDAYARSMDERVKIAQRPYSRTADAAALGIPLIDQDRNFSLPRVWCNWCKNAADNRLLSVALALRAYKLDHGTYPPALQALVPAYLPADPTDPFAQSPAPLRYHLHGATYVLYSVGPDGKDDDGRPSIQFIDRMPTYFVSKDSLGDFVAGLNS